MTYHVTTGNGWYHPAKLLGEFPDKDAAVKFAQEYVYGDPTREVTVWDMTPRYCAGHAVSIHMGKAVQDG